MANNDKQVTGWVGWVYFAGFLMFTLGVMQMIAGLAALLKDSYYLVGRENLLVFDYTTWGWSHLLIGLFITLAGMAVVNGKAWGRVVAVILAAISFIANFVFLPSYPIWSVIMMTVNVLVIYALTVHGKETQV